mmetsp:Transcript_15841/g.18403  ORF Transcript_15841/g.18403 Transcript_15841/m.18403 type:complete len:192 (-) Transcript_15841:188-763(-)
MMSRSKFQVRSLLCLQLLLQAFWQSHLSRLTRQSSDTKESIENDERQRKIGLKKSIIGAAAGSLFSAGLAMSGMIKQYKVLGFLNLSDINNWDPSLMFVMGGGLIISFGGYQFVKGHGILRKEKALTCPPLLVEPCKFKNVPTNTKIDKQIIHHPRKCNVWNGLGYCWTMSWTSFIFVCYGISKSYDALVA